MDRNTDRGTLVRSLVETIERIHGVARCLPPAELKRSVSVDSWSPNEILWHIRATADVYHEHIARILNEDSPTWRHVSPRSRMKKARYDQQPFVESLAAFEQQRVALVTSLEDLAPEAWGRVAIVRVSGKEWRLSLNERVWGMASHEELHCAQMEQAAAKLSPSPAPEQRNQR